MNKIVHKQPKVSFIEETEITKADIDEYIKASEETDMPFFSSSDLDMPNKKRIVTFTDTDGERVHLVNPKLLRGIGQQLIYFEADTYKSMRMRKTIRYKDVVVETDNLGEMTFGAEQEAWKNMNDYLNDRGMLICVYIQRLIDAINGIDITHSSRRYSSQIHNNQKMGRNERIMMQGPDGDMVFVKNKHSDIYQDKGYKMLK